jgi:hypothetical protein
MRTIFDGLVEEFRAWHLFEQHPGDSPQRELPGLGLPGYGPGGYEARGYGLGAPGPEAPGYGEAGYDRGARPGRDLRGTAPWPGTPR